MRIILRIGAVAAILYASWLMVLLSLPYVSFEPYVDFLFTKQLVYKIHHWRWSFYIHVFVSTAVLVADCSSSAGICCNDIRKFTGARGMYTRSRCLHSAGRAGWLWGITRTGNLGEDQLCFIRVIVDGRHRCGHVLHLQKDWKRHADMMTRSYALTLSAVTLRFYIYLIALFQLEIPPRAAYIWVAWLSWTLNLMLAEYLIRRRLFTLWRGERSAV